MDTIYSNHWNISSSLADHHHYHHHPLHQSDHNQFNLPVTESGSQIDCATSPLASILSDGSVFNLLNGGSSLPSEINNLPINNTSQNVQTSSPTAISETNAGNDFLTSFGLLDADFHSDQSCDFSTLSTPSRITNVSSPTNATSYTSSSTSLKECQSNGKVVCRSIPVNCLTDIHSDIGKVIVSLSANDPGSRNDSCEVNNCATIPESLYIHHVQPHHLANSTSSFSSKRSLLSSQTFSSLKETTKCPSKRMFLDTENRRRSHHQSHHSSSSSSSSYSSVSHLGRSCDASRAACRSSNCDKILSPEDEERRRRRRERNKVAATKCRNKKKFHVLKLCQESQVLETTNRDLKEEIQSLEREQQRLKSIFQKHLPYCCVMTFQT